MKNKIFIVFATVLLGLSLYSCGKFLDSKPYNSLTHPNTLHDLDALLNFEWEVNHWYPGVGELASDDFSISFRGFSVMLASMQDAYIWQGVNKEHGEWQLGYKMISIANVILEGLERIKGGDPQLRTKLEGEALFLRGWALFNLAQIYCAPYSVLEPKENLGLVLRKTSDSKVDLQRSTLDETYRQIFEDLHKSVGLLPERSNTITRYSRLIALAALARAYHSIENYEEAEQMVNKVMAIEDRLVDFNDLDDKLPFPLNLENNVEVFNYAVSRTTDYLIADASTSVVPELYDMYEEYDLRKKVFFEKSDSRIKFKGFFHGINSAFLGLAQDEMYLIKAECAVRRNDGKEGTLYLNRLLANRYETARFIPLQFDNDTELLDRILQERRKELVFRGVRWMDLRRLNRYPERATILEKSFSDVEGGKVYRLMPNDKKYVFLIPQAAIDVGGYEQNPR